MDFIRRILQMFAQADGQDTYGYADFGEGEEIVVTIHPSQDRYVSLQYL
jgi:hypothetical protein